MKIVFVCAVDLGISCLGIEYLSSFLKEQGYDVDLVVDEQHDHSPEINSTERDNLDKICSLNPDLIGFSIVTAHYQWALKMAKLIKDRIASIPIIFGGPHPTAIPQEVLKNQYVDMVCVGEGEYALTELMASLKNGTGINGVKNIWAREGKNIICNNLHPLIQNLDELPFPDKDIFLEKHPGGSLKNYVIMSSRGCAFACSFCSNNYLKRLNKGSGKFLRSRSVGNVIEELKIAKKKYKLERVSFADDMFTHNSRWIEEFLPKYKDAIGLPFNCLSHVKFMDDEKARLLKEAGCFLVMFGIQSGSEFLRKKILNRNETNDEYRQAAKSCHKANLNYSLDHIFNLPFDNESYLMESLLLYNEIRPSYINTYTLFLLPNTDIIKSAKETGMVGEENMDLVNTGRYAWGINPSSEKGCFYRKFHMLFTLLPLLPRSLVKWVVEKNALSLFEKIPFKLQPLFKMILYIKADSFYVVKLSIKWTLRGFFKNNYFTRNIFKKV